MDEPNPVKDILFEHIENYEEISDLIKQKKFDEIIQNAFENCYEKIITIANREEALGILATGLLHYLLTNALINSQRKVEYNDVEIDIVIPDIKTLEKDPKKTLVIGILNSADEQTVQKKISDLEKIQPEKDNIWMVLPKEVQIDKKSFVISKDNNSFSKIIFEIARFTNVGGANKFKILRI